jgi:DNA polymerase III subunit delta'
MKSSDLKSNWPLVGNGHIFEFLTKNLAKKNISGSYIFAGPANLGKATAANFFARGLVCEAKGQPILPCGKCPACLEAAKNIHSDIYLIKKEPDKKNISIEQIRDFIRNLSMSSFLNSYKVGIIKGAENLSEGAVNALLKTLEEPKIKVVIILTVIDLDSLPKTIISRSQILKFRSVASDIIYDELIKNYKASRSQAKNFSRLSAGRPALALKFMEDEEYYENYQAYAKAFIGLLNSDVNERFEAIENILGVQARGQEAVNKAAGVIDIWQNLARDLMLMELNLTDLIQHEAFIKELEAVKNRFNLPALLNFINILKQSRKYLAANVNPKLALENAAVSF